MYLSKQIYNNILDWVLPKTVPETKILEYVAYWNNGPRITGEEVGNETGN